MASPCLRPGLQDKCPEEPLGTQGRWAISMVTPWATQAWLGGREPGPLEGGLCPGLGLTTPLLPSSCLFLQPASLVQMSLFQEALQWLFLCLL